MFSASTTEESDNSQTFGDERREIRLKKKIGVQRPNVLSMESKEILSKTNV